MLLSIACSGLLTLLIVKNLRMLQSWEELVSLNFGVSVMRTATTCLLVGSLPSNTIRYNQTGKYYAVEDMLTTDPLEKFGTITLQEHYNRIALEGQEYDPYTTMYVGTSRLDPENCLSHATFLSLSFFQVCEGAYLRMRHSESNESNRCIPIVTIV
jgi:hypothetical protein